ncbi:hypothetical protein [Opitutus sp. GAS368]|jgi:hypothetical protein|uniref:hypothetical protein n=1 Tax=Opitutus sp. GAS368 TaxID=1882749 RepID=UPI00087BF2A8|nr:hypothetical protein [Opitutus sp. GAS368]SDR88831.1 hypothetical protein SAMN05444173_1228 [Opitutus sp. GAS368]
MNKKMTPEDLEKFIHRELRALPPRKAPPGFEQRLQAAVEARLARQTAAPEQLEQFIHRELRALPPRRAPRSLESRVLAAIEHQAAVAWYHKSWAYWPAAVKAAFLAVGTGISGAVITASYLMSQGVDTGAIAAGAGHRLGFLVSLYSAGSWIVEFGSRAFGNIPSLWLYGGLGIVAALYATFFGLGAVAYRTLYHHD